MDNREQIKNRMVKTAARLWGHPEDEPVSSFDPLVGLLFTACAVELEKINGEIEASRARLLDRAVQLLSPQALNGALPAHAIMHARSIEQQAMLRLTDQFFLAQRLNAGWESGANKYTDIYFSPTAAFHINDLSIRYLATGHQLFTCRDMVTKEVVAHCLPGKELSPAVLWLGFKGNAASLHHTQCYFDIKNEVSRELFYQHLPQSQWTCGHTTYQTIPGYNKSDISGEQLSIEQILLKKDTNSYKACEQANAYYKNRFITLKEYTISPPTETINAKEYMPAALLQAFDHKDHALLQEKNLCWVKVQFPENIPSTILQDVVCHFNSFPVINRRLYEMSYRMQDILNIIPLPTADTFFDVQEITDQEGVMHNVRHVQKQEKEKLTVVLRHGGVARFDERNAAAITEQLLQLLSDESAAFAVLGREFMAAEMKQLQQIMYKLEQQLHTRNLQRDETPFLVVRPVPSEKVTNLLVSYWSTKGSAANNIKAGSVLQAYKTADGFHHQDIVLLSPSVGGRDKLAPTDRVNAYRSALLSRDRIISMEDIKRFCQLQLGHKAKSIKVEKGVMVSQAVSQGFARTIDVYIGLHRKDYLDAQERSELTWWKDNLVKQLTGRSAGLTPFRVFIEQVV